MTVPCSRPAPNTDWHAVSLFGGAITARLPERFADISNVRPVPDHQEVWADDATDQSVIVELAEHSDVPNEQVGRFVFQDLAEVNEAASSTVEEVTQLGPPIPNIVGDYFNICPHTAGTRDIPHIPSGTYACLVTGTQQIAKSREGPEQSNKVCVLLCVIRLPQYQADLLISVNAPTYINASSSSADHASQPGPQPEAEVQAKAVMQGLLQDLEIADEGLFG